MTKTTTWRAPMKRHLVPIVVLIYAGIFNAAQPAEKPMLPGWGFNLVSLLSGTYPNVTAIPKALLNAEPWRDLAYCQEILITIAETLSEFKSQLTTTNTTATASASSLTYLDDAAAAVRKRYHYLNVSRKEWKKGILERHRMLIFTIWKPEISKKISYSALLGIDDHLDDIPKVIEKL